MLIIPEKCDTDNRLKEVKTCFGGFSIYKRDAILSSSYKTYLDSNGLPVCEHQGLNENIKYFCPGLNAIIILLSRINCK